MTKQTTPLQAPAAETLNFALADLILSDLNPRQEADPEGIAALAGSIKTVGLMQNLSGLMAEGGKVEIVAGGRRLRALQSLAETGEAPEFVAVRVTTDRETAMLWASTENTAREDLHPADEIRAYYRMLTEGNATIAQVALAFGVTEAHVRRRTRLGALPAPVIDALKAGKITIGHAQAMTVGQDEALILAALEVIANYHNPRAYSEHEVRRMVSPSRISATDRRLKFVGRDAYDAAGGKSTVDLFENEAVLHSADVLDRIFAEKLDEEAQKALSAGWKWAKTLLEADMDHSTFGDHGRLYKIEGDLTEEQAERYDELAELAEGDALDEDGQTELDSLEAILEGCYTEDQRALSGIVLHVNWRGDLTAAMGLVDPEDIPAAIDAGLLAPSAHAPVSAGGAGADAATPAKPALSQSLLADLQAMRGGAIQGAMLDKPKLALDLLAFALSCRWGGPLDLRYDMSNITPSEAEGYSPDPRLDGGDDEAEDAGEAVNPFAAFRAKGEKHRNAVLARIVARTLRYGYVDRGIGGSFPIFDEIEAELKANIRQVWTPTAANFFGRVNAVYLENLLADLTGCDRTGSGFKAFCGMKKKEKAETLERLFTDADYQKAWQIDAEKKARIDAWVPAEL